MANDSRHIYVDADACPVKDEIVEIAAANGLRVTMVANYSHEIDPGDHVAVVRVDQERDAADIVIANRAEPGDIVVTEDAGLAAMVLGKGARALSPRGEVYDNARMESVLAARHHAQKARRAGIRLKGPPRLTPSHRKRFRRALERLVRS